MLRFFIIVVLFLVGLHYSFSMLLSLGKVAAPLLPEEKVAAPEKPIKPVQEIEPKNLNTLNKTLIEISWTPPDPMKFFYRVQNARKNLAFGEEYKTLQNAMNSGALWRAQKFRMQSRMHQLEFFAEKQLDRVLTSLQDDTLRNTSKELLREFLRRYYGILDARDICIKVASVIDIDSAAFDFSKQNAAESYLRQLCDDFTVVQKH